MKRVDAIYKAARYYLAFGETWLENDRSAVYRMCDYIYPRFFKMNDAGKDKFYNAVMDKIAELRYLQERNKRPAQTD